MLLNKNKFNETQFTLHHRASGPGLFQSKVQQACLFTVTRDMSEWLIIKWSSSKGIFQIKTAKMFCNNCRFNTSPLRNREFITYKREWTCSLTVTVSCCFWLKDPNSLHADDHSSATLERGNIKPLYTHTRTHPEDWPCLVSVCLQAQVIFLPCGHVCCCHVCSDALQNCPLCRSSISQRIRLYHS